MYRSIKSTEAVSETSVSAKINVEQKLILFAFCENLKFILHERQKKTPLEKKIKAYFNNKD